MGDHAGAATEYQAVLREQPSDPAAEAGLGLLLLREEKWQASLDVLEKVKASVPDDARVIEGIGAAYAGLGNCEKAVDPLRAALDLTPDNFALAKKLASCNAKLKRWSAVLSALRTGTLEESRDEDATRMVVDAYVSSADVPGAESYCRWVLIATPSNFTAHLSLANLLFNARRTRDAFTEYLEVVKLKPEMPDIQERLGDLAMELRDSSEARVHYEAATRSASATDTARMKLARLCFAANDAKCTQQALAAVTNPAFARESKLLRAQIEFRAENWEQAGLLANELLPGDPQSVTLLRIAAESSLRQNKPVEAADLFEKAMAVEPANKEFRYRLARLTLSYDELKDRLPRTVEQLSEFLQKFQQDAEAYFLLANVYRKLNDAENAKANFKMGFDRIQPPISPSLSWAYNTYGFMMIQEGKFEEAYQYETQAIRLNPGDEDSQFNFALVCLALNKTDDLAAARDRLLAMNSKRLADLDEQIESKKGKKK